MGPGPGLGRRGWGSGTGDLGLRVEAGSGRLGGIWKGMARFPATLLIRCTALRFLTASHQTHWCKQLFREINTPILGLAMVPGGRPASQASGPGYREDIPPGEGGQCGRCA